MSDDFSYTLLYCENNFLLYTASICLLTQDMYLVDTDSRGKFEKSVKSSLELIYALKLHELSNFIQVQ